MALEADLVFARRLPAGRPSRNVYVGAARAPPLDTETPEMAVWRPETVQPVIVWVGAVAVALCELWQSVHRLCRFEMPPNSLTWAEEWVFGARGSVIASWR
jgi:hypothetical protein